MFLSVAALLYLCGFLDPLQDIFIAGKQLRDSSKQEPFFIVNFLQEFTGEVLNNVTLENIF